MKSEKWESCGWGVGGWGVGGWGVGGWAAALLGLVVLGACDGGEEPPLSAAEREEVARTYADSVRALTEPTDSACEADRPGLVAELVDSIYRLRLADIEAQAAVAVPESPAE